MRWQLLVVGLFACGSSANGPVDGSIDGSGAVLQTDNGVGGLVSIVEFENALVGQSSSALVHFVNRGTVATGTIDLSITGPNEDEFAIDAKDSTCAGAALPGLGRCVVVVHFRPTAAGMRTASLTFGSSPGGSGSMALSSFVLLPSVHFEPTVVELPVMQVGTSMTRAVQLRNDGALAVSLRDLQVVGPSLTLASSTCTDVLPAHSSCDVPFVATPIAVGRQTGLVQVTADGATFAAPVRVRGVREVTISKLGNGSGRVTGISAGIDCGATCRALATSDLTLTATPDGNSVLTGWSIPACGSSATCVVPFDAFPVRVTATFVRTTSATITVSFAGTGGGDVRLRNASGGVVANCHSTCTIPVNAGGPYKIDASTWSQFSGFSANCPSTEAGTCELMATAGTTTVTVTFDKRTGERFTRFLPGLPIAVDLDSDDNVVVATNDRLIKLSSTGTTAWSIPFEVLHLATGPRGLIYVAGTHNAYSGLFLFDANGVMQWKVPIPTGYSVGDNISVFASSLAVGPDGAVVAIGAQGVMRWDSKGTVVWSKELGFVSVGGVGVKPDGTVVVGRKSGQDKDRTVTGEQFAAADGAPLSSLGTIGREWRGDLAVDSTGGVAMHNSGDSAVIFQWRAYSSSDSTVGEPFLETGTCVIGAGPAVYVTNRKNNGGWILRRMAEDGTMAGSIDSELFTTYGFGSQWLEGIACGKSGNTVVIGGNYSGFTDLTETTHAVVGYVQLFE